MCENWLDTPYAPKKRPEKRGGPMTTLLVGQDAFGTQMSFPLAYKCSERIDEPNPWKPYVGADGASGFESQPHAPHGTQWLKTPKVSVAQASFLDPSPQRDMTKKALQFADFNKALAWEAASTNAKSKLKETQSMSKEQFVDRLTGHRDALKPAETLWSRAAAADRERAEEYRLAAQRPPLEVPQTAPSSLGGRPQRHSAIASARAREAKKKMGGQFADTETSNFMPWYSSDAVAAGRSEPPEWTTRKYSKLCRSSPSLLSGAALSNAAPKMSVR